jgi:hypothetical protein
MSTQQMFASATPYFILPARELERRASELAKLELHVATNTASPSARARIAELRGTLAVDAAGRAMAKLEAAIATNARQVAANAGDCGGRVEYSEQVLRRDGQGRPIDVIRTPIRTKRTAEAATVTNAKPAGPRFAPPVAYWT